MHVRMRLRSKCLCLIYFTKVATLKYKSTRRHFITKNHRVCYSHTQCRYQYQYKYIIHNAKYMHIILHKYIQTNVHTFLTTIRCRLYEFSYCCRAAVFVLLLYSVCERSAFGCCRVRYIIYVHVRCVCLCVRQSK